MKSRNGSYKKILIDSKTLKAHGLVLRANIDALKKLSLSPQEFITLYLLLFLRIKHPKNWIQKKSKSLINENENENFGPELLSYIPESFALNDWEKEKLKGVTAFTLFSLYNLKAIPESINRTMIHWFLGYWSIEMLEHIPTPRELLRLQVKNTRCITVITDPNEIDSFVLETRDPLSFVLHDLMHADQFFSQIESQKGQLGFYQLINSIYDQPDLRNLLKTDANFKKEFEYVASDMNAYVIHLFKCLKSSISRIDKEKVFFDNLLIWWKMNEEEKIASHKLSTPHFNQLDEMILKTFFENNQEIL
ncbi:MAG: hypothetical protein PHY93_06845 [Bacteriovorax sp.]|nr:hypothetical protein [Bacteriovorax sp.]